MGTVAVLSELHRKAKGVANGHDETSTSATNNEVI